VGFCVLGGSDGRGCDVAAFPSPKKIEMNEIMRKKLTYNPNQEKSTSLGFIFSRSSSYGPAPFVVLPSCGFPSLPAVVGVSSLVVVVVVINNVVFLHVIGRLLGVEMVVVKGRNG
jgi:hypothetical protein